MNKTKQCIILSAINLYNKRGFTNVLNQDVAKETGISLSNFNYHFPAKKDLILAVCAYLSLELEIRISRDKLFSGNFIGLEITKIFLEFEMDFKFFYLDTFNILNSYPEIKVETVRQVNNAVEMIKNLNFMSIGKGYLKPEPIDNPGLYDHIAHQLWMQSFFWYAQSDFRNLNDNTIIKKGLESSYAIIYPYLTKIGIEKYQEYLINVN
jgi:AcrR family transcriptional regulator|tara:strand:+ start:450 stop:1076 length:627 start_codon:yes stop_codon:yes gene_type:complete